MVTPSASSSYYPASGENLWSHILSTGGGPWRRAFSATDLRYLSNSKGRIFDSSDPREASKLMNNKLESKEPRHSVVAPSKALPPRTLLPRAEGRESRPHTTPVKQRQSPCDTCIYQQPSKDLHWYKDVDHRWCRPRLTGFWCYGTDSRVAHLAPNGAMHPNAHRNTDHLAREFNVPDYRKSEIYQNTRPKSSDPKLKKDLKMNYAGENFLINKKLDSNGKKDFVNLSEVQFRQCNGYRDTSLVEGPFYGRWQTDFLGPGKLQAMHEVRNQNVDAPLKKRMEKLEQQQQLKMDRLQRTRLLGHDRYHSSYYYQDSHDPKDSVPVRVDYSTMNFHGINHLQPKKDLPGATSATAKLQWENLSSSNQKIGA